MLKWCLVIYLHPADHNRRQVTKPNKDFAKEFDFKDIKFPVKFREIHKIDKKNFIDISISGYEDKKKYPIYVTKKCCEDKHVDSLLIDGKEKKPYVLIKDFNTFMYDQTLHPGRKRFCRYCLKAFSRKINKNENNVIHIIFI